MEKEKIQALKEFLNENFEEDEVLVNRYGNNIFSIYGNDYLILTDEEADEKVKEEIKQTMWAFNSDFIIEHSKLKNTTTAKDFLEKMQHELCEGCQEFIEEIVEDFEEFVEDAIRYDGRGHFLSYYDGNENEQNGFFIYRV